MTTPVAKMAEKKQGGVNIHLKFLSVYTVMSVMAFFFT